MSNRETHSRSTTENEVFESVTFVSGFRMLKLPAGCVRITKSVFFHFDFKLSTVAPSFSFSCASILCDSFLSQEISIHSVATFMAYTKKHSSRLEDSEHLVYDLEKCCIEDNTPRDNRHYGAENEDCVFMGSQIIKRSYMRHGIRFPCMSDEELAYLGKKNIEEQDAWPSTVLPKLRKERIQQLSTGHFDEEHVYEFGTVFVRGWNHEQYVYDFGTAFVHGKKHN